MTATSMVVHDAVLVDAHGRREQAWLRTDGATIAEIGTGDAWTARTERDVTVVDARGAVVTPGFIDLHCHGGAGVGFDDADPTAALHHHRAHGTTRSLLSLVSAPADQQAVRLARVAELTVRDPLVLGSHLEGPFLATARCGAHDPNALVTPSPEHVAHQLDAAGGSLRMVTMAPELVGADDAIETFRAAGVVVAVGHTEADYDTARRAFARGATVLTHAYNAMAPVLHRAPGPVMAAVDSGAVLELILDGVHVHPSVAAGLFRLAPGRVALVTDAIAAAGCGDGTSSLGAAPIEVHDGCATLAGTNTLAGSLLTLDVALRHAIEELAVDPVAAVAALTAVPASVLGRDDLGVLRVGGRADLVVLDEGWRPTLVVAEGEVIASPG